jgi:hypothetical protein
MMLAIDAQMLRLIDETYEYSLEMKEECAPIIWTEEDNARAEHHKKVMAKIRAEEDDTEKRLATVRAKIAKAQNWRQRIMKESPKRLGVKVEK